MMRSEGSQSQGVLRPYAQKPCDAKTFGLEDLESLGVGVLFARAHSEGAHKRMDENYGSETLRAHQATSVLSAQMCRQSNMP